MIYLYIQMSTEKNTTQELVSPKEKRIILIRHAESEFNAAGSNKPNCPLTQYGRDTSALLKFDADLVVCSTLRRARETLDHSGITYNDVIFTDLCRELLDGSATNYYNGEELKPESEDEFNNRLIDFRGLLKDLQESYDTICVITHHGFLERMTGFRFHNCHYLNYSL